MLHDAARLRPDHPETRIALSGALLLNPVSRGAEFEELLRNARASAMLDPGNPAAQLQVALVPEEMARAKGSLTVCRRALRLQPTLTDARHIAGINRLRRGDFVGGMADFEARKNNVWFHADGSPIPIWDGRPLPDDTVALAAEGGRGRSGWPVWAACAPACAGATATPPAMPTPSAPSPSRSSAR
ncbi:hypothetical protein ABMY26_35995 (plasmid) [Azospirillum sp. HJ39]|uniref:hypothetical protein n=1 Tax=Azospirillum sp. HJ39 TaxID=3159496 RepID=UPI003556A08B